MKKKILALSMAFVLVIGATFGITFAWLTSETGTIKNTFTVGDVAIKLKEEINTKTGDAYNVVEEETTAVGGTYKIIPGTNEHKAPFVEVAEDSEDCYIFMLVKNDFAANSGVSFNFNTTGENGKWTVVSYDNAATNCTLYRYSEKVSANGKTANLFDTVTYADTITSESIGGLEKCTIQFKAYAIQATGTDMTLEGKATTQAKTWAATADDSWN